MNGMLEVEEKIINDLSLLNDINDKYIYIIDLGKELQFFDEKYKTEQNKIPGCKSDIWIHLEIKNGKIIITADSNTAIIKGIISLIIKILSNKTPKEILDYKLEFMDKFGIYTHLSPQRSNGINVFLMRIIEYSKLNIKK